MMTEIENLQNGNLLCIETENYLENYLLHWYILLAELMNGCCWLDNNTVYNNTRMTSTVTKPHKNTKTRK